MVPLLCECEGDCHATQFGQASIDAAALEVACLRGFKTLPWCLYTANAKPTVMLLNLVRQVWAAGLKVVCLRGVEHFIGTSPHPRVCDGAFSRPDVLFMIW